MFNFKLQLRISTSGFKLQFQPSSLIVKLKLPILTSNFKLQLQTTVSSVAPALAELDQLSPSFLTLTSSNFSYK